MHNPCLGLPQVKEIDISDLGNPPLEPGQLYRVISAVESCRYSDYCIHIPIRPCNGTRFVWYKIGEQGNKTNRPPMPCIKLDHACRSFRIEASFEFRQDAATLVIGRCSV